MVNNRVKGMIADGDGRQEKLCDWKASKEQADTCACILKTYIAFSVTSNYHDS